MNRSRGYGWVTGALVGVCALSAAAQGPILAESRFDANRDGWSVYGDAQEDGRYPDFKAAGGNPGGYIEAIDDVLGDTWYFEAPVRFRAALPAAYGGTLSYELKQSNLSDPFDDDDILLISTSNLTLAYRFARHPGLTWTAYDVQLDESAGWKVVTTQAGVRRNATQAELKLVFNTISRLAIRGEFRNGDDTGGMDNVVLTAPVSTEVTAWSLY